MVSGDRGIAAERQRDGDGDLQSAGHDRGDPEADDNQDPKPGRDVGEKLGSKREPKPQSIVGCDIAKLQIIDDWKPQPDLGPAEAVCHGRRADEDR
jgi:hypothetical protein